LLVLAIGGANTELQRLLDLCGASYELIICTGMLSGNMNLTMVVHRQQQQLFLPQSWIEYHFKRKKTSANKYGKH
jgi:hypothetical protein